jgi:hydroxyacylglutathione hydrolase
MTKTSRLLSGGGVIIFGFVAGAVFKTNCYIVADAATGRCTIIDPGQDATDSVVQLINTHSLRPESVLLTHGHMDHSWDCVPLSDGLDIPLAVHSADRRFLTCPEDALPASFPPGPLIGYRREEPRKVVTIADGDTLRFGALSVNVVGAPGHTPGSVMFHMSAPSPVLFTGDNLADGKPGLTVEPVGDAAAMRSSLRRILRPLPDETALLTGHGRPQSLGNCRRSAMGVVDCLE